MSTAGGVRDQTAGWVREQAAYVFGMYAYAYGFPPVMMDVTRQVITVRVYQPRQEMLDGPAENHLVVRAGTYRIPPIQSH